MQETASEFRLQTRLTIYKSNTSHFWVVVDLMIRFRDPVRVIQLAKRSRSQIVCLFVRSVEFPVAVTPQSLTDSAENRAMACIP